jgi:predicted metalloprotease with PDZ domain
MQSRIYRLVSLSLSFLVAALVWAQQPTKKCNQSARECEQEIRQMLAGKLYLGVEVEERNMALIVKTVAPESPAWRADLEVGDRLIAVGGHVTQQATIKEFKAIINQLLKEPPRSGRIAITVQRNGILKRLDPRPEPYSRVQIDKIVAQHLLEAHPETAQQGTPR